MNQGVFWGIMIIIFGIILLAKHVFNLDFPVLKVMLGVFLIMLGIKFLFFKTFSITNTTSQGGDVVFGSKEMDFNPEISKYNSVFGSLIVDMTKIKESPLTTYEVNCVFGETTVVLNKKTKLNLHSDVVMGSIENPNPNENYEFENIIDSSIVEINIKASAVFGSIKFIRKE